jgi:hypothetical protein
MQNESVHIRRICRMKESSMQNESVCVLRIRGTNLYVYLEYVECTKSWISRRILNQNLNYFKIFIKSLVGSFRLAKRLKTQKISSKRTFNPNCSGVCRDLHILRVWAFLTSIYTVLPFSWSRKYLNLPFFMHIQLYSFYMCSANNNIFLLNFWIGNMGDRGWG